MLSVNHTPDHARGFAKIQEQVTLSGGNFEVKYNAALGVSLRASWLRVSLQDELSSPVDVARALRI